jgi:hypothetical protein
VRVCPLEEINLNIAACAANIVVPGVVGEPDCPAESLQEIAHFGAFVRCLPILVGPLFFGVR